MGLPIPNKIKDAAGGLLGGLGGFGGGGGGGGGASSALSGLLGGGSGGGGGSNPFGSLFGDKAEKEKDKTGKIAPQFATSEDAEAQLLNYEPMLISDSDIDLFSTDWEMGATGSDITHIQNYVRAEFMRREKNFGMHYPEKMSETGDRGTHSSTKFGSDDFGKDQNGFLANEYVDTIYRGPKTAWARFVSNATTMDNSIGIPRHEGFIMHGVEAFSDMYGFSKDPSKTHKNVIGFDASGGQHRVNESDFKHRPPPGVMNVKVEYSGISTGERKTTIEFVCWSRSQLDYLQPYFFTVGVTALVEFGWNNFPREALIDISPSNIGSDGVYYTASSDVATGSNCYVMANGKNGELGGDQIKVVNERRKNENRPGIITKKNAHAEGKILRRPRGLVGLFKDGHVCHEKMKSGKGNYSFAMGMISNYSYSLRQDGGYDCSVELTSMAQIAKMMTNDATKAQNKKSQNEEKPDRMSNFKDFIAKELDDIVDAFASGNSSVSTRWETYDEQREDRDYIIEELKKYRHAYAPASENKANTYHAGSNTDKFISLQMFVSIINLFFVREVENKGEIYGIKLLNARCIAHPNIKSTDGKILLIPNALAPRRNITSAGRTSQVFYNYTGIKYLTQTSAFGIGESENQTALNEAYASTAATGIATNMRDNLHAIITQAQEGKSLYPSRAFPDFAPGTKGMSGRIGDLFVNTEVVKDAVKNHKTMISILDAVMKKISTACCDIWDFKVVPQDSNLPNCTTLTIKDMKYYGNKTVETIKRDSKAYIFRAHQKNSIVRNLDLDIQVPAELKSMVVYDRHDDAQVAFYQRQSDDRILKKVEGVKVIPDVVKDKKDKEAEDADNTNTEYFIVPLVTENNYVRFDDTMDVQCVDINKDRVKESMTSDKIPENAVKGYNQPIDGCEMTLTIDGIEGLRMLDAFNCTGIPTHWFMNGIWQITGIDHTISNGDWETSIKAIMRPNSNE